MKSLVFALSLLFSASVFAAPADRDVLLTPGGTLYTVEAAMNNQPSTANSSARYLALTVQKSGATSSIAVPESLTGGNHWRPKLAYDNQSDTLFVFWLRSQNSILTNSDLVFAAYQNGSWTAPTIVDDAPYRSRSNFSVAVTRKAEMLNDRRELVLVPALTLHLVWWNESRVDSSAYYASIGIETGSVIDMQVRPLSDFVDSRFENADPVTAEAAEIFRHPTVLETPEHQTVEILFGDIATNRLHRTSVKTFLTRPQPNLRVRIPIGVKDHGFRGPARALSVGTNASISAVPAGENGAIFYSEDQGVVKYITYRDKTWTGVQTIVLGDNLTGEAAVTAIRRMAASE